MAAATAYLALYGLAVAPGLPVGWRLFGVRHAAGWIAGALLGYALACLVVWLAMTIGGPFGIVAPAGWLCAALATFTLTPWRLDPLIDLGVWTRRHTLALSLLLLLAAAIAILPLRRVGERDASGNVQYRAYFTADFLWHMALTAELTTGGLPPRNPYLAPRPMHYYWTYFLVPAAIARAGPPPLRDVQTCLKGNALATGLLFISAVFIAACAVTPRTGAAAIATGMTLVASSAEGAWVMWRVWQAGESLSALKGINVDALSAWEFHGHRIDGLQRCLWYVPQHSMAYALGLIALAAGAADRKGASPAVIGIAGAALGGSVLMNPFVGGLFAAAWGISTALNGLADPAPLRRIARHLLAAVPVVLALVWCVANRMVEGAAGTLIFGWGGASRNAPLWNLTLSLGPALAPALLLLVVRPPRPLLQSLLPALSLAVISLVVMHTVRLSVDEPWVPFRAGQMLLAVLPSLVAGAMVTAERSQARKRITGVCLVAALLAGLPTTVVDTYNAQDVTERGSGAGFHWTLILNREEQEALAWIRRSTPRTAIVQMEPTIRDRELSAGGWGEHWSVIPSFAERRMTAGIPISLLRVPAYAERSELVRQIFATADAREAARLARKLGIQYLYIDPKDREAYPGCAKFDTSPAFFDAVFRLGGVAVYRLR